MKMKTENQNDLTYWYDLWMKQSKEFFDSTDKHLKGLFDNHAAVNPEEHLKQIHAWLETLKNQWQFLKLTEEQSAYEKYVNSISVMCIDASNLMVQKWIQRYKDNRPIKTSRELYELWLDCCHEVYESAIRVKSYQEIYGDFMNAAIQYWKVTLPK